MPIQQSIVRPAMTALEAAEARAMQSEPPSVPVPRVVVITDYVSPDTKHDLAEILHAAPQAYKDITAQIERGSKLLTDAAAKARHTLERLNELKNCLEQRGHYRHQVRLMRQELEGLVARFGKSDCTNMAGPELWKLELRKRWLPRDIEGVTEVIDKLSIRIAELKAGFDVPAIIKRMDAETRLPNGGFDGNRHHVHAAVERGDIADD